MPGYDAALLEQWKKIQRIMITADQQVCLVPCYLFAAVISSNGSGEADAIVYDGHNTTEEAVLHLDCNDEEMDSVRFNPPMYFSRGLYVDVGNNVAGLTLHFLPFAE